MLPTKTDTKPNWNESYTLIDIEIKASVGITLIHQAMLSFSLPSALTN